MEFTTGNAPWKDIIILGSKETELLLWEQSIAVCQKDIFLHKNLENWGVCLCEDKRTLEIKLGSAIA